MVAAAILVVAIVLVVRFALRDDSTATKTPNAPATPAAIHRAPGVVGTGAANTKGALAHSDVGTLRLEGQVIDEQLQPIGGAQVTLLLEPPRKATTEADGSFAFDNLAAGPYRLVAHKEAQSSRLVRARLSATSEPVTLRLRPGATVVVRVIAADGGAPIAGATVSDRARSIITAADGIARLGGMAEGFVDIAAPGYAPASFSLNKPEEPQGTIERTVSLSRGALMAGTVVGPDGAPIADATVAVESAASKWSGSAKTDAKGAWSFAVLAADRYALTASSEVYAPAPRMMVELDGKTPRTGVVVRVEVGAQLVGTVVDAGGRPVAGANVKLAKNRGTSYDETTDASGRFALLGISAGEFWVSASTATQASPRIEVTLVRDQRVEVHLVMADGSLAGIVVDSKGEPVAEAVVIARPKMMMIDRLPNELTDARGAFDFGGVPAGEYELVAARAEQNDSRRLEGTKINAPDRSVKLVLPDVSSITGRVLLDGQPMPYYGLIVTEHPRNSWQKTPTAVRSPDGRFTHNGVAPGSWGVVVGGPGVARKVIENVVVTEGKVTDLGDITLDRGQKVHGRVTTPNGVAVAGATVSVSEGHAFLAETPLKLAMQGNASVVTDAAGAYSLDGIVASYRNEIVALHPTLGSSGPKKLAAKLTTLDLVISPVGGIDGTVVSGTERVYLVTGKQIPTERSTSLKAEVDGTGGFTLDNLVPGDYELAPFAAPGEAAPPGTRVTVVANKRTAVTLTMPTMGVTLAVHYGAACRMVMMRPAGEGSGPPHEMLASAMCDDKGNALIEGVSPGSYRVCPQPLTCAAVTVTETPPRQTIEVPAAK